MRTFSSPLHMVNSDMNGIGKIVKIKEDKRYASQFFRLLSCNRNSASRYCCNCYPNNIYVTTMNSASNLHMSSPSSLLFSSCLLILMVITIFRFTVLV